MRSQIEKNKEILCDEIEKLSEQKMSEAVAAKLSIYRGAYKALCMAAAEDEKDETYTRRNTKQSRAAQGSDHHTEFEWVVTATPSDGRGTSGHLTFNDARQWTSQMCNEDGSIGPHWSLEQTRQIQQKKKELQDFDEIDVFAVINMMYSDYCAVAKELGVNNIDFYVGMTKAWLEDGDVSAGNEKTMRYYEYIVR